MKKFSVPAAAFAALCTLGAASVTHAQSMQSPAPASQEMQFPSMPSKDGSQSPPSTLRMTVTPDPSAPPPVMRDTEESRAQYVRCREVSDRAAVSNAQMQAGVAQCLKELEQRRQQQ
ncbi:hypothetical protein YH64_025020 [Achromobacter sp. LC458]|uniref:Uncharacterized protein n=1 Tax=Achromobacter spanius TaxID=217203 RepID=A0A2S5GPV2_9BURK|nr:MULTISPECIES: hypothetical protein [Achromobacter]PPA75117.1 hypothetical protein C4E15_17400 [Achromobacter spanius]TRM50272.1 hypothetical protein YH64_025020 [Achromobacter sp. LC458]